MSAERHGCRGGWEPDLFGEDCVLPHNANAVLGGLGVALGAVYLSTELFIYSSSSPSFSDLDREDQATVIVRGIWVAAVMVSYGPLAYGEWDDTRVQIKWGWIVAIIGSMWVIIRVYRRMREGFGAAFALLPF